MQIALYWLSLKNGEWPSTIKTQLETEYCSTRVVLIHQANFSYYWRRHFHLKLPHSNKPNPTRSYNPRHSTRAIHRFYRRTMPIEHLLIIKDNKTRGRGWLITAPGLSINTHKTAVLITSKLYNWTNTAFNPFRNDIFELLIHALPGVKCFLFVQAKVISSDAW